MLKVNNLHTTLYVNQTQVHAVSGISFDINAGETFALIGESGSGKSITALSLIGLIPTNGVHSENSAVNFDGKDLLELPEAAMRPVRGGSMAMIFQDPMTCLNPVLTIADQIAEVLQLHQNIEKFNVLNTMLELLDSVRIADPHRCLKSYPHELSGGMKQRVMIAMALAGKPKLLIADEPTTALDVTTQAQILSLLKELQQRENMAILLITHDLDVAAQMADHIGVMYQGTLVEKAVARQFFEQPKHEYSKQLFASRLAACKDDKNKQKQRILLDIKDLRVYFPVKSGILRKTSGYVKAVDGITLQIQAGETLALVGESGCGKTTIGKAILSLIEAFSGKVYFAGQSVYDLTSKQLQSLRSDLQVVFQDPFSSMDPRQRIGDIIAEGICAQGKTFTTLQIQERVTQLLLQVGLEVEHQDRYPHEFSGGQRQRICVARALALDPKLLICDEPTSALDMSVQAQVLNLLKDLQRKRNLAYLFITHDISVVGYMADYVAVMYLGKIVEYGKTKDILSSPQHPYTQALLSAVPDCKKTLPKLTDIVQGELPSAVSPPKGCHFNPRCKNVMDKCLQEYPRIKYVSKDHYMRCYLEDGLA